MTGLSLYDIGLPRAKLRAVARKAKRAGTTPPEYVRSLIEQDLLADQSFDRILRPIRQDFRTSGVTERELDALVHRARRGARSSNGTRKHRTKRRR